MLASTAVAQADLRVLLMCVFHLTGDQRWLSDPFRPQRDVNLIADEQAGLSDEAATRLRVVAAELIEMNIQPVIDDPGNALMLEMMQWCLGEDVPPEYAPMMREEMGFASRDVAAAKPPRGVEVLVVGAGASGIALGVRLMRLGVRFTIVERSDRVGGVWRDNRYPGAGVDTPNHAYSYSFTEPNQWSRFFAPQPEIEDYLQRSADDAGLMPFIDFETTLTSATWEETDRQWVVTLETPTGPETRRVGVLISAIGQLNEPSVPTIAGIDSFGGQLFHSARWPDGLDVAGKNVAIVGTGASSMQIVPAIADTVDQLTIYQRSPQWARPIPRYHEPIPEGSQYLFEHLPYYAAWFRMTMLWRYGDGLLQFLRKDPDWPHPERSLNRINDRHRVEMTDHIRSELATHPDLIEDCLPDYPPYGKRILLDNGWFQSLTKPNVELVTEGVRSIDPTGIVDEVGDHREHDIIVLATGFNVTEMTSLLNITGRDGVRLADQWANDNPTAYLGITVPGFPNLFCVQGPNTGLAHGGSAIFQSECQARYICSSIAAMADAGARSIEVRRGPHDDYVERVDAEHEQLVWTHPGMSTYYRNAAGRVVSVMPWRLVDYWSMTHDVDLADYMLD